MILWIGKKLELNTLSVVFKWSSNNSLSLLHSLDCIKYIGYIKLRVQYAYVSNLYQIKINNSFYLWTIFGPLLSGVLNF